MNDTVYSDSQCAVSPRPNSTGIEACTEFLRAMYETSPPDGAQEVFCMLERAPSVDTPWPPIDVNTFAAHIKNGKAATAAFYISTMRAYPDANGRVRNQQAQFADLPFIVLDDVGTKVSPNTVPPTAVVETSAGNYQYAYALTKPITDRVLAGQFTRAVYEAEVLTDQGGKMVNKYVRLPAGINGKEMADGQRNGFQVRLVECDPSRRYSWQQLLEAWGLELARPKNLDKTDNVVDFNHPVLRMVKVKRLHANSKWDITCPNVGAHTGQGRKDEHERTAEIMAAVVGGRGRAPGDGCPVGSVRTRDLCGPGCSVPLHQRDARHHAAIALGLVRLRPG